MENPDAELVAQLRQLERKARCIAAALDVQLDPARPRLIRSSSDFRARYETLLDNAYRLVEALGYPVIRERRL